VEPNAFGGGAFGITALAIAHSKLELGFGQAVAVGVLCNALASAKQPTPAP
jgi:formate/nitrite transporter FocA (FNT family)